MIGALAKATALAQSAEALDDQKAVGPGPAKLVLQVNGSRQEIAVEPRETLLDVLRNRLQLTGAKEICDRATCGGCTVLVNGQPIYACMKLAIEMDGQEILTVEGLRRSEKSNSRSAGVRRMRRVDVRLLHTRLCHVTDCPL